MNSAIIYRGLSRLDNRTPIVVVATGMESESRNAKTGGMVQTYILVDDVRPADAIRNGADKAICGSCPHRLRAGVRSCYVNMATGLSAVGRHLLAAKYPEISASEAGRIVAGRAVRLGTYGDPAAVPVEVWHALTALATSHTGYTHQWRTAAAVGLQSLLMASVDSDAERTVARLMGWRTFRVRRLRGDTIESLSAGEIVCPASAEGGHKVQCDRCGLCAGASRPAKDIAIIDHSPRANAARRRMSLTVLA